MFLGDIYASILRSLRLTPQQLIELATRLTPRDTSRRPFVGRNGRLCPIMMALEIKVKAPLAEKKTYTIVKLMRLYHVSLVFAFLFYLFYSLPSCMLNPYYELALREFRAIATNMARQSVGN